MKISLLLVTLLLIQANADNTPPTISADRHWNVMENAAVGQKISHVRALDPDDDQLIFSLHTPSFLPVIGGSPIIDGARYFRIDPQTGAIFVKESMQGLGGRKLMLGIGVNDGHLTAKMEVMVNINSSDGSEPSPSVVRVNGPSTRITNQQTSSTVSLTPPKLPESPVFTALPPRPEPPPGTVVFPEEVDFNDRFRTPALQPVTTAADPSITPSPPWPQSTALLSNVDGQTTTKATESIRQAARPRDQEIDMPTVVVPVVVVVAMILLLVVGVLVIRRKSQKRMSIDGEKGNKMETLKTVSNTTTASSTDGDADTSITLQHWTSKKAVSNRYESWHIGEIDNEWRNQNKTDDGWEFPRHHLRVISILGEGCFGQVWKCEALNIAGNEGASFVAVKTLKESAGDKERQELLKELQVMKTLKPHPNIVTLLGCCTDKDPVFVIMEWVNGGKLQSFLRKSRAEHYYGNLHGSSSHLTSRDLTSFAYQVARAMDYLTVKGIIHRDLAARNVLITEDRVCKVADFGFARDVMGNHIYERKSEGRLPIRWMAPESLYDNIFSAKTDVWSFGILLWEIVTLGSTPYPGMAASEVMRKVREGYRLEKPEHCRREVYNIMFYCWEKDPAQRPAFSELVELLEQLLMSETDYIELERFPDHSYYNMTPPTDEKI